MELQIGSRVYGAKRWDLPYGGSDRLHYFRGIVEKITGRSIYIRLTEDMYEAQAGDLITMFQEDLDYKVRAEAGQDWLREFTWTS